MITCADMMLYIQEKCEEGAVITIGKDFAIVGGSRLWSIRGAGVNAGGYLSLTEAFVKWREAIEYDRIRNEGVR